jgi:salicylate hydroxylase
MIVMSSQEPLRVAIVGAGIGGLATAIALRREGFLVEVYERAAALTEVGAAIFIRPQSVKLLTDWGLADDYAKYRTRFLKIDVLRGANGKRLPISLLSLNEGGYVDSVHRGDLHHHLAAQIPAEAIHLAQKCQRVQEHADFVELHFTNGSTARASLVIAADGIHSAIRPLLNKDTAVFSGQKGYRAVLPIERVKDLLPQHLPSMWVTRKKGAFLLLPVQNGKGVAYDALLPATQEAEGSWTSMVEANELIAKLAGFDPTVREIVRRTEGQISAFSLYDREPITHWNTGHIALLGDAAHPMLPYKGQGANQAIQDAAVLAECLRGVTSEGIPAALQRYSSIRIPVTRTFQRQSRRESFRSRVSAILLEMNCQVAFLWKTLVRPERKMHMQENIMSNQTKRKLDRGSSQPPKTIARIFTGMHVSLYRLSGGKIGGSMRKASVLLLNTTGRKTGKLRTTPVMYLRDADRYIIVASDSGAQKHPVWWLNLRSTPQAKIEIGGKMLNVVATQADPEERHRLWLLLAAMYSGYEQYQQKTTRELPVVILTPVK